MVVKYGILFSLLILIMVGVLEGDDKNFLNATVIRAGMHDVWRTLLSLLIVYMAAWQAINFESLSTNSLFRLQSLSAQLGIQKIPTYNKQN
jgi:hypothetical protein